MGLKRRRLFLSAAKTFIWAGDDMTVIHASTGHSEKATKRKMPLFRYIGLVPPDPVSSKPMTVF